MLFVGHAGAVCDVFLQWVRFGEARERAEALTGWQGGWLDELLAECEEAK